MTGYFDRLSQRAQGAAALVGLPVIRPLPALYRGHAEQHSGIDTTLEVEVETPVADPAMAMGAPVAGMLRNEPAPVGAHSTEGHVEQDEPTGHRPLPGNSVLTEAPRKHVSKRAVVPERSRGPIETARQSLQAPSAEEAGQMIDPADPPARKVSRITTIEQIVEAIEADPPAKSEGEPVLWTARATERESSGPVPPPVSIGRIDIVVAPPPIPPPAPARTRGFENYARLRRGLAR
jgi:hypothetical protein